MMKIFLFDMGLPMIFPSLFLMALALGPVVLIEAYIIRSSTRKTLFKTTVYVGIANLISTIFGIPLTWILLAVVEFLVVQVSATVDLGNIWTNLFSVTIGAPWVAPGHDDEKSIILGAMLFLLIPYCLASWWLEYQIIKLLLKRGRTSVSKESSPESLVLNEKDRLSRAVGKANVLSYILLGVLVIVIFAFDRFTKN